MPRILLCSGEPILTRGLENVVREMAGFDLLPSCVSIAGLQGQLACSKPDVLLLELGPEVTPTALNDLKQMASETAIVLWVTTIPTELAFQAIAMGIRGILRKQLPVELLVKCLQAVCAGELWFEKDLMASLIVRPAALTNRERQLVSLLSQGLKNKEIAATMVVSEGTVKVYLSRLYEKLGVKDRFELALFALRNLTTGQQPAASNKQDHIWRRVHEHCSQLMERRPVPRVLAAQSRVLAGRLPID